MVGECFPYISGQDEPYEAKDCTEAQGSSEH